MLGYIAKAPYVLPFVCGSELIAFSPGH